jgi:hypothetical protein
LPNEIRDALGLPRGATFGDAIALAQAQQAIKGETAAAKEIREAIEERSIEQVNQERESSVVMINASNRPDWAAMRRAHPKIEVPGLDATPIQGERKLRKCESDRAQDSS